MLAGQNGVCGEAQMTVDGLLPMRRGQPPSQQVAERTEQRLGWLSVQERRRRERSPAAAAGSGLEETSLPAAWAQGTNVSLVFSR